MSERRYLEQGAVITRHPTLDEQVVPRKTDDKLHRGSSGRIENPKRRFLPVGKKWFAGVNVQAQHDPLVETYPVGLRKRRACMVVTSIALLIITNIVLFALALWMIDLFNINEYGSKNLIVNDNDVGFLYTFAADEIVVQGEGQNTADPTYILRPPANTPVDFSSSGKVELNTLSSVRASQATLDLTPARLTLHTSKFLAQPDGQTDAYFSGDVEQSIIQSSSVTMDGSLSAGKLDTPVLRAPFMEPLNVTSTTTVDLTSFDSNTITAQLGLVTLRGETGVSFNTTNDIPSVARYVASRINAPNGNVVFNLSNIARPDAVSLSGQEAFALCVCETGLIYSVLGNTTCSDTLNQYLTPPC